MNIALACKGHNRFLAEVDYGRETMARHRRKGPGLVLPRAPQLAAIIDTSS